MRIENHLKKIEKLENSVLKLDDFDEDYEALVEIYMLISAHYINTALHKLGTLNISKDIKHNKLFSFLKEGNNLGKDNESAMDAMKKLDDLRPSHIYGSGENGNTAKKAREYYDVIKGICRRILNDGKLQDSD